MTPSGAADDTSAIVTLEAVDEEMLVRLTAVAVADAAANDVTPPVTPGDDWTPERVAWFQEYHRACRSGGAGSRRETAWAVVADGEPVGCVRLQCTDTPGVLEVGIWLARRVRGRGVGGAAIRAAIAEAARQGATGLVAETTATNSAALALLRRVGFVVNAVSADGAVHAERPVA